MLPPSVRSLPRMTGRDNLRGRNEQSQQAPPYNRTSRVAAWNEQRLQASTTQARVAIPSGINSSPSGPAEDIQPRDEEPWHLQEPLYRDHSGFPITRGMMERSVRESRLRFSDNFTQMGIPFAGSLDEEDQEEYQPRESRLRFSDNFSQINIPWPGAADKEDQAEHQPRLDQPHLDQPHLDQPRLARPHIERPRLDRQYYGEARAETPSQMNQPRTHESQAGHQSRRRDPEYIRELQAAYQARHYQDYTRRLCAERQSPIDQPHAQRVEAQNQSRRTPKQFSEFQTEVQGSRVQRYPQQVQAEYRSRLNEEHHSESQAVRQVPQAPHFQQYPWVSPGQNQPRVRHQFGSRFQATHQPREISLAEALRMDCPPADGFNGNPLVTIIPPAPEVHTGTSNSRTSNSLEGECGAKNEKKKKIQEIKEKAIEAKAWLLKSARDGYAQRGL